jgi:glutathione S-transferase
MWALEELGLAYELEIVRPYQDTRAASLLAVNPNGKIPVLIDGDLVLWESLAINLYLAHQYGAPLWPTAHTEQAIALQWSFWVVTEVEPHLWEMWQARSATRPDEARARIAEDRLRAALTILDSHLADRNWITDGGFSVADLNLESYIIRARRGGFELTTHTNLWAWIERCEARPARQHVRSKIVAFEREQAD